MPLRAESVAIRQLTLKDFRNYAELRLDIGATSVVLTGPNGAGKTNLLEALSLLIPGRGLRGATFEEMTRREAAGGWAVAAKVQSGGNAVSVGTAYEASGEGGREPGQGRRTVIEGVPQKSSGALARHIRVVWLTPQMDRIFSGPAGERRRFFDRLTAAIDPDHGARLFKFDKLMRERNRLLHQLGADAAWLSSLEHQMAEGAVALAASRLASLDALGAEADDGSATAFPKVSLALDGLLEKALRTRPAVQIEDLYRKMLHDSRNADRTAGRTLAGPHRSDLRVLHRPSGKEASECSTGEQKAMLISVILAHAKAMKNTLGGMLPVLLLDEAVAHLDADRRTGLFGELGELGAQCWLTGTDRALFAGMDRRTTFYSVTDGAIEPID